MDALCPAGWSAADAASFLQNREGNPPKRETVRDWLTRDAVPAWVWPQLRSRMQIQRDALADALKEAHQEASARSGAPHTLPGGNRALRG
jgi:hypothetical protein